MLKRENDDALFTCWEFCAFFPETFFLSECDADSVSLDDNNEN